MKTRRLEKGEATAIAVFGIFSIVLFILSIQMYMKDPNLSSQGAFPLFLSSLMVIMSGVMLIELKKYGTAYDKAVKLSEKIKAAYEFLLPGKILHILILIVIYAIVMPRVGFVIATLLYLWISMIVLKREGKMKSLLASVSIVVFILIIFQFIFKVILP